MQTTTNNKALFNHYAKVGDVFGFVDDTESEYGVGFVYGTESVWGGKIVDAAKVQICVNGRDVAAARRSLRLYVDNESESLRSRIGMRYKNDDPKRLHGHLASVEALRKYI